ncbi:MAG TPA: FAD-dependent oxidoreductase [Ignavibacteria bacterium]|nr:FAD-dependent oxidoreductase [Ignavibacteria bacterium]
MSLSFWEKDSFINYDFIIAGSGILGLSVACEIKENDPGRSVLVLEKGILPSGASTKNAGFACFGSFTEILSDFERIGEDETIELVKNRYEGINILRERLGDEKTGLLNYGGYELINADHLDSLERIDEINNKLKFIFPDITFEPANFKISEFGFNQDEVRAMIYSRFESQIDTGKMMNSLIEYSGSLGVKIINGCKVDKINEKENYVKLITENSSGKDKIYFNAKSVIVCTNAFTGEFYPELNIKPGRGQVIVTKPVPGLKFKGVFHFDEGFYYFRNFGERVIFGGGRNMDFETEETSEFESNEIILNDLKMKLDDVILPGMNYEIDYSWSGIMGFNDSKRPEIKKISDRITAAISCNGMGIALSSYVAKKIRKIVDP